MRLAALAVVALVMALNGDARAGGNVDWSAYIDKDGTAPLPKQTAPVVAEEDDAPKAAPAKRVAKATKAKKTSKAKSTKAKTRAKTKKRRK